MKPIFPTISWYKTHGGLPTNDKLIITLLQWTMTTMFHFMLAAFGWMFMMGPNAAVYAWQLQHLSSCSRRTVQSSSSSNFMHMAVESQTNANVKTSPAVSKDADILIRAYRGEKVERTPVWYVPLPPPSPSPSSSVSPNPIANQPKVDASSWTIHGRFS